MTRSKHVIISSAKEEFRLARKWYKEQGAKKLSDRFSKAVYVCIETIVSNPYAYSIRYKNVRIAHTEIFPYEIHFYIQAGNNVVITAIIFHGRDQAIAQNRVNEDRPL